MEHEAAFIAEKQATEGCRVPPEVSFNTYTKSCDALLSNPSGHFGWRCLRRIYVVLTTFPQLIPDRKRQRR